MLIRTCKETKSEKKDFRVAQLVLKLKHGCNFLTEFSTDFRKKYKKFDSYNFYKHFESDCKLFFKILLSKKWIKLPFFGIWLSNDFEFCITCESNWLQLNIKLEIKRFLEMSLIFHFFLKSLVKVISQAFKKTIFKNSYFVHKKTLWYSSKC